MARTRQCKFRQSRVKAPRRGGFALFTGIVESACPVLTAQEAAGGRRLVVDLAPLRRSPRGEPLARLGDSLAVNGCCLTVAGLEGAHATFDVVPETLGLTNLGTLRPGSRVNVERSLRVGDALDGHFVSGHVERTGRVVEARPAGGETRLVVDCGSDFASRTLPKGSVTVDGVSLTVAELGEARFTVALVPHTLSVTTLGERRPGDLVNLEPDLLGQWVLRGLATR